MSFMQKLVQSCPHWVPKVPKLDEQLWLEANLRWYLALAWLRITCLALPISP